MSAEVTPIGKAKPRRPKPKPVDTPNGETDVAADDVAAESESKITALYSLLRPLEVFRTPTGRTFANVGGTALPTDSPAFARWAAHEFAKLGRGFVTKTTIDTVMMSIEGRELPTQPAPLRLVGASTGILFDIGGDCPHPIGVAAGTVFVGPAGGMSFFRPAGSGALPVPSRVTSDAESAAILGRFRATLGVRDDHAWTCCLAFLMSALRGMAPYVILNLRGEHGSGKTTIATALRNVIDPRRPSKKKLPRDERDLAIGAEHAFVLLFDNVSNIAQNMSDALCCLAYGDGFETRSLYSDRSLSVFEAARPIILTSITDSATRPDLLDRSLMVELPPLESRRDDDELERDLAAQHSDVLGALLYACSVAMRRLDETTVDHGIRMRAPARFAAAAEPALGLAPGDVERAYLASKDQGDDVAALDPVAEALLAYFDENGGTSGTQPWKITAGKLLDILTERFEKRRLPRAWPDSAEGMSKALARLAPTLRRLGIDVVKPPRRGSGRYFVLTYTPLPPQPDADESVPDDEPHAGDDGGYVPERDGETAF